MWASKIYLLSTCLALAQGINLYPPPRKATIQERPFQAAILKNGNYHCSGAVISPHCVLTACSCVATDAVPLGESTSIDVNYTLVTYTRFLQQGQMYQEPASDLYIVDGCNRATNDNDAAILCSQETLPGRPQSMVQQRTMENVRGIVSGWGISVDGDGEYIRDDLRRAYMRIISLEECRQRYRDIREVPDSALCAMATEEVRGFCAGDIGGPLTHGEGIVGIVVRSFGCEGTHLPGIFTNVSRISASIQRVLDKFDADLKSD